MTAAASRMTSAEPHAHRQYQPAERENERHEIQRERNDPDERHRGDVLGEAARRRDEQTRSDGRQDDPERADRSTPTGAVVVERRRHDACPRRVVAHRLRAPGADEDERGKAGRPDDGLRPQIEVALEVERIDAERQQRSRRSTARRAGTASDRGSGARTSPAASARSRRAGRTGTPRSGSARQARARPERSRRSASRRRRRDRQRDERDDQQDQVQPDLPADAEPA